MYKLAGRNLKHKGQGIELETPNEPEFQTANKSGDKVSRYDFLEVYTFHDPKYKTDFQAWRGWISKDKEYPGFSPLEKIKHNEEQAWEDRIRIYRKDIIANDSDADWVWGSILQFPYSKVKRRVY